MVEGNEANSQGPGLHCSLPEGKKKKKKKVPKTAFWVLVYRQSLLTSLLRNHAESTRNLSGIKLVSFQMQLAKYHQKDYSLQMIIPKQLTILMLWTSTKSSALQATDMGNIPHIDPQREDADQQLTVCWGRTP